jgi:hypothetical protein
MSTYAQAYDDLAGKGIGDHSVASGGTKQQWDELALFFAAAHDDCCRRVAETSRS